MGGDARGRGATGGGVVYGVDKKRARETIGGPRRS